LIDLYIDRQQASGELHLSAIVLSAIGTIHYVVVGRSQSHLGEGQI